MLPTGKATADDLRRLFSVPGRHVFRDAVVHVSVVGHQVAEWIVSDSYCSKSFEKAVSRCSVNQVNGLLRSAVASGKADFVRILIEKGADLNRRDSGSCLFAAAAANRVDIMQMLSANFGSVDMNSTDSMGRTPIHAAAMNGHEKAIRFISFAGGDSDLADKKGFTPLHLAAEKGHLTAAKSLMEISIYSKHAVNKAGKTPYDLAVENGCGSEICEMLSPVGDELQRRSVAGDAEGVRRCLGEGAEVNGRDQNGWSPLHRAAFKGKTESVKVLLGKGAEVDAVDGDGYTPLHCAVEAGQLKVAVMLIGHGAKVSLKGVKGGFPFGLSLKNHPSRVVDMCEAQKKR
ncbi:Protein VAPYRIN-LIKE [Linum grandiflorum]